MQDEQKKRCGAGSLRGSGVQDWQSLGDSEPKLPDSFALWILLLVVVTSFHIFRVVRSDLGTKLDSKFDRKAQALLLPAVYQQQVLSARVLI